MAKVGWLVPAAAQTKNMDKFEKELAKIYKGKVSFPDPQFLGGDNNKMKDCVDKLLTHKPPYDIFAVAGSTGVDALMKAGAKKIVQVVGGNPAYHEGKKVTGHHFDVARVATAQVDALNSYYPLVKFLTILYDPTSATSQAALSAAQIEAAKKGIWFVNAKPAATPDDVRAYVYNNPIQGMFMLCPSGMFYDATPMQDIIKIVKAMGAPAIFPEIEFTKGTSWYVLGHNVPKTYVRSARLAKDLLEGNLPKGREAPDKDNNTKTLF